MAQKPREKLGKLIVDKYINHKQLERALEEQKKSSKRLGQILINLGFITEEELVEILEIQLGFQRADLGNYKLDSSLAKYIPHNIAKNYHVVPLYHHNDILEVAMEDPSDVIAIDAIKITAKCEVKPYIATRTEIKDAQEKIYLIKGTDIIQKFNYEYARFSEIDERHIIKLVDQIIHDAIICNSSDIHFEPNKEEIRIRYRINGVLEKVMSLPRDILDLLISRIKVMSGLDITKKRITQSGRMEIQQEEFRVSSRVSVLPTLYGEKIVIRLLSRDNRLLNINRLGFSEESVKRLRSLIEKPYGIILVTGPTSSGKTTTLFASLSYLNDTNKYIVTIEDPIEYQVDGIYQVQVSSNPELNFNSALRTVLRQDPDIIMIGEIRDRETAEIAVRASMTGHLVLATMHTNDACSAITRLLGLGIPPYLIYSTLQGIIAQRLVRVLCTSCKQEYTADDKEKEYLGIGVKSNLKLFTTKGCPKCNDTGYIDRTAVEELLIMDKDYEELIMKNASKQKLERLALKKGFTTMKENAKKKVIEGVTTISEIKRVLI